MRDDMAGIERGAEALDRIRAQRQGLDVVRPRIEQPAPADQPAISDADENEFSRLAALHPVHYDRERKAAAKALRISPTTLDAEIKKRQPPSQDSDKQGEDVICRDVEPWPERVDGAELLKDVAAAIKRYVALPVHADVVIALWVAHAYLFDVFDHTPRLNITAPEKECGKSLLLDIIQTLTPRALRTDSVTTAVLFRLIDAHMPTLLIDEYDSFLRDNEELRGALNAGHKRGGRHLRCEGDDNKVRAFKTFAPVALAGIGALPGTLADRSIVVSMKRAMDGEIAEPFDSRHTQRERALQRKLARLAVDYRDRLKNVDPDMPTGFYNRRADNWRSLLAIADVIGGDWPKIARDAALALSGTAVAGYSIRVELLTDIRQIFYEKHLDRMSSANLAEALAEETERPWCELCNGKPITPRRLAHMLSGFEIVPVPIRLDEEKTRRGYDIEKFKDAFARYLPPFNPLQRYNALSMRVVTDSQNVTEDDVLRMPKPPKAAPVLDCNGITDRNPPDREIERFSV